MNAFVTEGTPDARKNGDSMKYVSTGPGIIVPDGRGRIFKRSFPYFSKLIIPREFNRAISNANNLMEQEGFFE